MRVAAAFRESVECIGAAVIGSFEKESADRLFNIDLAAFCAEGAGQPVFRTLFQQIAPIEILFTIDGKHSPDGPYRKLIFAGMTLIEFHVIAHLIQNLELENPFVEIVS